MSSFKENYTELAANNSVLRKHCPKVMQDFSALHGDTIKDSAVSSKTKELIALGIAVAVHCDGCIFSHVRSAVKMGATIEEMAEAIEVAILMGGGPATIYGGKAMAVAEALLAEKA